MIAEVPSDDKGQPGMGGAMGDRDCYGKGFTS
jgi:hypothetical protein